MSDEEGPWLGGELTQMGTGSLLISSLRQFVYLSNLDLKDESSQHNLHIIDKHLLRLKVYFLMLNHLSIHGSAFSQC